MVRHCSSVGIRSDRCQQFPTNKFLLDGGRHRKTLPASFDFEAFLVGKPQGWSATVPQLESDLIDVSSSQRTNFFSTEGGIVRHCQHRSISKRFLLASLKDGPPLFLSWNQI